MWKSLLAVLVVLVLLGWSTENGKLIIDSDSISITHKSYSIALSEINQPGANAPTKATKGTTPTINGWLFDNVNEKYQLVFHVPDNWNAASDVDVGLYVVLNQAETAGDVIDWTMDYVVATPGVDAVTKTSTTITTAETILEGCAGDACAYRVTFVLDYGDADNPIEREDLVHMEIHRTDLADCGGVIVVAADAHTASIL